MNTSTVRICFAFLLCTASCIADEGMFPVSEIGGLDLKSHGLQMEPSDIFNPDETCLIDGICRVNGCTGSFVSASGLVITNHHCAYRAIQSLSTADNDLLKHGFKSNSQGEELHAKGYTIRITESYRDISKEVLSVVTPGISFVERTKAIDKRRKELEKQAETQNPGMRADIAEMFTGKTYVLFLYTYVKDVRLVFAPPASVGAFGGDVDNWEWPRHTGDFSFMRAYVAPDGSTAEYSENNVPYKPKRFIQVAPQGVDEGDFVFLLGYPGRTARHKTSSFLDYEENVRLPYIVDLYQWQIETMEAAGKSDRSVALKHSSRSKSLANVEKRSRGQLKGMKGAKISAGRAKTEAELQAWIEADPQRKKKYGSLFSDIKDVYAEMTDAAEYELNVQNLRSACRTMSFAFTIIDAVTERAKPDLDRESAYMDRNFDQTSQRLMLGLRDLHVPTDKKMLVGMLERLSTSEKAKSLPAIGGVIADSSKRQAFVDQLFANTKVTNAADVADYLKSLKPTDAVPGDSFLQLMAQLYPTYLKLRELDKEREGRLGQLYGSLVEAKMQFQKTSFVPDANGTLRLTHGHIRGYTPDGKFRFPITTLKGVIEKTTGVDPFITPQRIQDLYATKDFGQFAHPKLKQVPVAILYDTDTTGGNSGSPILNAKGQLVGVNFDRAFEATINDFAWDQSYSRSLGVDIRYALWITGKVFGADRLLDEMGVK